MSKIVNTIVFVLLAYVVPLLGQPRLIFHYKMLILIAAAITVFLTQPGFKAEEAKEKKKQDQNTVWLILCLSLAAAILPVVEWAYWHPDRHHNWALLLGLLMIIGGVGLRVWAIQTLGKFFTATVQITEQHQLIITGPYSLVRHPSYLGAFLAMLGCATVLEAWWVFPLVVIVMLYAYYVRIKHEEHTLVNTFGKAYEEYQQNTARLIPLIW
jgi:protein-S-isoprenylcysteine O-methyltransferase Ste14